MESWVQSWRPRTNACCDFSTPPVKSTAPTTARSYEVLHLSRKIISANLTVWYSRKKPGPRNSSDEHVSCTVPATENASFQILFKCHTPAIVFGNATKPSWFYSLLVRCTIPSACHAKQRFKAQKWREHVVLFTFWLRNVLHATTACTFSSSQLPKVVRAWCSLHILTWKCATRHNDVHFFIISTSKNAPNVRCFYLFHWQMCFAPQWCALFRHLNFQKWSGPGVFCTFWLRNVLCAPSRHNGMQFFISHLASSLRTRRFSEPTFRPSEPQIIGKTCFATFLPFRAPGSSFFWDFFFFDLLSSFLFAASSHLCFSSVHIVGSLTSKLPSIIMCFVHITYD